VASLLLLLPLLLLLWRGTHLDRHHAHKKDAVRQKDFI
jgi:hypothetical protein